MLMLIMVLSVNEAHGKREIAEDAEASADGKGRLVAGFDDRYVDDKEMPNQYGAVLSLVDVGPLAEVGPLTEVRGVSRTINGSAPRIGDDLHAQSTDTLQLSHRRSRPVQGLRESFAQMVPLMKGMPSKNSTQVGRLEDIKSFVGDVWLDDFKRKRMFISLGLYCVFVLIFSKVLWGVYLRMTKTMTMTHFFTDISTQIRCMIIVTSLVLCITPVEFCLDYSDKVRPGLDALYAITNRVYGFLAALCVSSIFSQVHRMVERKLNPPIAVSEIDRQSFMHMVCNPTGVEEPIDDDVNLRRSFYTYIWIPFYLVTQGVLWLGVTCWLFYFDAMILMLVTVYLIACCVGVVLGAQTIGKDLYGGLVILMEEPFAVGDLISIEDKGGAGQCVDTVVTGFVQRIGLRSTTIRRFDMRACVVPNHYLSEKMLSNWKRPRKLIFFQFSISHRTPIGAVKLFSEKALLIIKNHPDVDQMLYTKGVFRKLDSGYDFQVVCYNAPGTKKQFVQQDLIYRFSQTARDLGIVMNFNHSSLSVQREQTDAPYQAEESVNLKADLSTSVPPKKEKKDKPKTAPKGLLLLRVDHLSGEGMDTVNETGPWTDKCFFVKVTHPAPKHVDYGEFVQLDLGLGEASEVQFINPTTGEVKTEDGNHNSTSFQFVDPKTHIVSWFESLAFEKDPKELIPSKLLLEVFMSDAYFDAQKLIGDICVDMAALYGEKPEAKKLSLKVPECGGDLMLRFEFFVGKDLSIEGVPKPESPTKASAPEPEEPSLKSFGAFGGLGAKVGAKIKSPAKVPALAKAPAPAAAADPAPDPGLATAPDPALAVAAAADPATAPASTPAPAPASS